MSSDVRPKFRSIHPQAVTLRGKPVILLQDPLRLSDQMVFIPQGLAPILALSDGSRNLNELRASLMIRAGISTSLDDLEHVFRQLDEALLLDNRRSAAAVQAAVSSFRAAPYRPSNLAGRGYPADPEALKAMLDSYLDDLAPADRQQAVRGLVSPHIDFDRGGPVYAQVWSRAREAAQEAELVVILGTDHNGGYGRVTMTRQNYATPYGVLPTETSVVDAMVDALGEEVAFEEELNHRTEHSIELAAVWLHHIRGGKPCAVLPILMGSFQHFVEGEAEPAEDRTMTLAVQVLQVALQGRRSLVVAAGDLAHVGPAFDGRPVDSLGRAELEAKDAHLIGTICSGDPEAFFQTLRAEGDRRNVCGLPPIYLALRVLGETRGLAAGYDRCPADAANSSFVSICGVILE